MQVLQLTIPEQLVQRVFSLNTQMELQQNKGMTLKKYLDYAQSLLHVDDQFGGWTQAICDLLISSSNFSPTLRNAYFVSLYHILFGYLFHDLHTVLISLPKPVNRIHHIKAQEKEILLEKKH